MRGTREIPETSKFVENVVIFQECIFQNIWRERTIKRVGDKFYFEFSLKII